MIGIIGGTGLYAMRGLADLCAREVQLGYCTIALATDYDSWLAGESTSPQVSGPR